MSVEVRYYSDPACTWSWAAEPALRRLIWEFEGGLDFVWAMGGLARRFGSGHDCYADLMSHWLNVAGRTGMPCDPRLWTEAPISSSFPACIAVEAAAEQGWAAGYAYLRRLREGLLCFRRPLDRREALVEEAGPAGLDLGRFTAALDSGRAEAAFEAHLEEIREVPDAAREAGHTQVDEGHERLSLPSAVFVAEGGERHGVYGVEPLEAYRAAALAAGATPVNSGSLPILDAVARFGRCAEPELRLLAQTESAETRAALWRHAAAGELHPVPALTGTLWELP